jgi:hypothetical protein
MSQATIGRILAIEQEASRIRDDAAAQAAQMIADFEREESATRARTLGEARARASLIEREGQENAQAERGRALAQAEASAREMEERAARNLAAAVEFVLDRVAGRA